MKRWKKAALILLTLLLLSQAPFIYRRYRLGRLHSTIDRLNAQRSTLDAGGNDPYADHRGVVHVHSLLGGHSEGRFEEIVSAARANDLDFVVMTEHPSKHSNTAAATLRGLHDGVLFINGSELNTEREDRLLILPGDVSPAFSPPSNTAQAVGEAKRDARLVFVAYPEQFNGWDTAGDFDGIEVYSLYTNARRANYALLFFDALWAYGSYPHLLFATFYERPAENLKKWDELMAASGRRLVALAGNDAHQNVGLSIQDLTGAPLVRINLDPYERSFRVVRTHVLIERTQALDEQTLLTALDSGHSYIAFDLFCDSEGFRFTAENETERRTMGDEIRLDGGVRLRVRTPVRSRMIVFKDGRVWHEERDSSEKELAVSERGVYRVEVHLDALGRPLSEQPWIISNPIYVR